jgi:uracil-DNA glycosylase
MPHEFDEGYAHEPFRTLCRDYPADSAYPAADFRSEWGPIFHRGRLDGSARVLVIGQDPAAQETIVRRILTGEAGLRLQGFLAKLGVTRSYVLINTYLYSVVAQSGGDTHKNDPAIAAYRHRWIDAIFDSSPIEGVLALGTLAKHAWDLWKQTPKGQATQVAFAGIIHPTADRNVHGDAQHAAFVKQMLQSWNQGLNTLKPAIAHPDEQKALVPYGDSFTDADLAEIPEIDVPAGLPAWMRGTTLWASRNGSSAAIQRATIEVVVPPEARP